MERDRDNASLASFEIQVSVSGLSGQFFTREGGQQGAEHLLIGYQQFLQSGVKVKTLEFLQEILLGMDFAVSMFFLFLPISSFGRHRTIVPLRGTLLPIVKPVRTPVAILGSLGVCIYVPASRHWLISYSLIHLI